MALKNDVIAAALIVSTIILFVTENLFHYPIAVMTILGCIQMAEQKVFDQSLKYLCWIFFAVFGSQLERTIATKHSTTEKHAVDRHVRARAYTRPPLRKPMLMPLIRETMRRRFFEPGPCPAALPADAAA